MSYPSQVSYTIKISREDLNNSLQVGDVLYYTCIPVNGQGLTAGAAAGNFATLDNDPIPIGIVTDITVNTPPLSQN